MSNILKKDRLFVFVLFLHVAVFTRWDIFLINPAFCYDYATFAAIERQNSAVLHVPHDYKTIQSAVSATTNFDTILVVPGIYNENIDFLGKNLIIKSVSGPESTIIKGGHPVSDGSANVVRFVSGETDAHLEGFTLEKGTDTLHQNSGSGNYKTGGGIIALNSSRATIRNCIITDNNAYFGGGISCQEHSSLDISQCSVLNNSSISTGGGVILNDYYGVKPDIGAFEVATLNAIASVFPTANSISIAAGDSFQLDINVGTQANPVENLFGVSFVLHYNSTYVSIDSSRNGGVSSGDFLGTDDRVILFSHQTSGDSIGVAVTRKGGDSSVDGYGTVAQIFFKISPDTPDSTRLRFWLTSVSANDSLWNPIELIPSDFWLIVVQEKITTTVWPADTNNDGIVDIADILPIGLAWQLVGPERPNASEEWQGQECPLWPIPRTTYVDVDGNGIIDIDDVNPIGTNWGKTRSMNKLTPPITSIFGIVQPVLWRADQVGEWLLELYIKDAPDVCGLAFETSCPDDATVVRIQPTDVWGVDRLYFEQSCFNGDIAGAIVNKAGRESLPELCYFAVIQLKTNTDLETIDTSEIGVINISAINASSEMFRVAIAPTIMGQMDFVQPQNYQLYPNFPNPFNSVTKLKYALPSAGHVMAVLYNIRGQKVKVLVDQNQRAGIHFVEWDGTDSSGESLPSGVFFIQFEAGDYKATEKILLAR